MIRFFEQNQSQNTVFELQPLFLSSHHQRAYKTLWPEADFPVACLAACPWLTLIQLELTSTTQWHLQILHPGNCFSSLAWLLLYFSHGGEVQVSYWKSTDFHAKKTPSFAQFSAHPQEDEGFLHLLMSLTMGTANLLEHPEPWRTWCVVRALWIINIITKRMVCIYTEWSNGQESFSAITEVKQMTSILTIILDPCLYECMKIIRS